MKTVPTDQPVDSFLATVTDAARRKDADSVCDMMRRVTGEEPVMWGGSIVGFGQYDYTYESGRSGSFLLTGFSPRKSALSIYIMPGFEPFADLMDKLGKHKTGRSCLYLKRLSDVDPEVLETLVRDSVTWMRERYRA
ncbi:MAG: DUF1801 domain-containing protein [Pseudomonadota bacterium]